MAVVLLTVCPDLESITLPELSIIRVLDPVVPAAVLFTAELLLVLAVLLYVEEVLALVLDLFTLLLVEPLERPDVLAILDLPLVDDL